MKQIKIARGGADIFDLPIDTSTEHLAIDQTEETAVLIALNTERRATADQARDASERGGWFGESYVEDRPFGSLLWTLRGRGQTEETSALVDSYVRDALRRWTDAGYDLNVETQYERPNTLRAEIRLSRGGEVLTVAVPIIT